MRVRFNFLPCAEGVGECPKGEGVFDALLCINHPLPPQIKSGAYSPALRAREKKA
jgi:hypothetical protein